MMRTKITRVYGASPKGKKDNTSIGLKKQVRQHVLQALYAQGIVSPPILDVFCGAGHIWRHVYQGLPYLGIDQRQFNDDRATIVSDSCRFLRHQDVHLDTYALFDIDAYGFPHEPLALICSRLQWTQFSTIGIVLTDASNFASEMNSVPNGLLDYLGVSRHKGGHFWGDMRHELLDLMIHKAAAVCNATVAAVVYQEPTGQKGNSVPLYLGYVMQHVVDMSTGEEQQVAAG